MGKTHVLVISYPAQGHVIPMMELVQRLAEQGVKVTFVNTEVTHKLVMNTWSEKGSSGNLIHMVSVPDGVESSEDRNDLSKLSEAIFRVMPGKLEVLLEKINEADNDKITCVIADCNMGWAIRIAEKMGIKRASFSPTAAAVFALMLSIQRLLDEGIINNYGAPLNDQMIQLSPTMPPIRTTNFPWSCFGDLATRKIIFEFMVEANETAKMADWIISNSANELEPAAFTLFPKMLPIGPLLANNRLAKQAGHFWQEDSSCLAWLDQQPACSVIYVAFGSFTIFDPAQFEELAQGLELTNRPFLWVVRTGMTEETNDAYSRAYKDRIGTRGRMLSWAPQQKVLAHPSVACFLSHCGWNSTLEGVSNGVPFLCWPYFGDQFLNQISICDIWKNGLGLNKNENGIITQGEIKNKVEQLLSNQTFKSRALDLKEKAINSIREGGCSHKNFSNFIDWIKERDAGVEC